MRKNFFFTMALATFALSQAPQLMAQEKCVVLLEEGAGNMMVTGISDNGKYVVGVEALYTGYIWDTETGKIVYMPHRDNENSDLWDISNNGIAVGGYTASATFQVDDWDALTGTWTSLPQLEEGKYGSAHAISPDGTIMAGWSVANTVSGPCLWKNGELTVLDSPLVDDSGRAPQRVHLTAMSSDASIMTGFMTAYIGSYELGLMWRASEYKCEVFFMDSLYTKGGKWDSYSMKVSDNGKWLGGDIKYYNPSTDEVYSYVYRYNLETKVMEKITDFLPEGNSGLMSAIDNNGTLYMTTESENPWARTAYIAKVGEPSQKLEDFLKEKYDNTEIADAMFFSGVIYATTPDGKILAGHGASMDEDESFDHYYAYVIRLDEAAGISCNKVTNSALKCYAVNDELQLVGNPAIVELTDMSGAIVRRVEVSGNTISLAGLSSGIYAAKLLNGKDVNVQKVVIK